MRAQTSTIASLSALLLLMAPGCSEDDPGPGITSDTSVTADATVDGTGGGDGTSTPDGSEPDGVTTDGTTGDGGGDGGPTVDAATDTPQEPDNSPISTDTINYDVEVAAPTTGEPGYPCASAEDCNSGWCVPSAEGQVCSKTCVEECPFPGWECVGVTDDNGNPSFVCLDQTVNLCNPCSQNKDCNSSATNAPNLCVDMGDAGNFCGMNCGQDGTACPPGYACTEIDGAPSVSRFQCLPAEGAMCSCNAWGQAQNAATTCNVVVEGVGACPGTRQCEPGGLSACAGKTPEPEMCNGLDDNCDGNVDEGIMGDACDLTNEFGTCQGALSCGGNAEEVCVGTMPAAEVCNGIDDDCDGTVDNGSPDFDGDGIADCVDPDDDGDNTLDADDCEPYNADIGLFAQEACDGIDNNCNGLTDEEGATGCSTFYQDADGDTYGSIAAGPKCLCAADPDQFYTVTVAEDCDDLAASAFPGGVETCNNVDDDCDGTVDNNLDTTTPCFISNSFGTCQGTEQCVGGAVQCVGQSPQAEICNALDDDCNGQIDDGTADYDNDGDPDCTDPDDDNDNFLDEQDCQPLNENAYPGAQETCDGTDTNCNGIVDDEDAVGCFSHYQDADADGYGSNLVPPKCLCGPDNFTYFNTTQTGDCNDINIDVNPGASETCNYVDDNCDGDIDEGVASPCGDCSSVCVVQTGEDGDDGDFVPTSDNSNGVSTTPDGGITLDSSVAEIPFIWIANTGAGTASKLNTETGAEVGRYTVCANPSRTAVDTSGNGIITGRHGACVVKIAVFEADCVDLNNNNQIDTSRDINNDGTIDNSEMVANDECILWNVQPDGTSGDCSGSVGCARSAGVDADGNVWVGFWNSRRLYELDGTTGATIQTHDLTNRPYGLAIDSDQNIWLASRDAGNTLTLVDPELGETQVYTMPDGDGYGIAIDPFGNVWEASGTAGGVHRFNTSTESYNYSSGDLGRGYTRGVAISVIRDGEGNVTESKVFAAHHTWSGGTLATLRYVSVFNIDPITQAVTALPPIDLATDGQPRGAVGVALDSNNNLWAVNQSTSTASKVDTTTNTVIGEYNVGLTPYTYSDMSGYALKTITAPSGYYRTIYNGWPGATTLWDKIIVEATLPGNGITRLEVRYRTADSEINLSGEAWVGPFGPFPPDTFPLDIDATGNVLELEIRMITEDPTYIPIIHDVSVIAYEQ